MKHVFIINSHTTYLTSIGVIDLLNFSKDEVLLVLVRNYKNDLMRDYKRIDASNLSLETEKVFDKKYNCFFIKHIVNQVDSFISNVIDGDFHLYAPHLSHPFWQIAYTSNLCLGFSYIQEGCLPFKTAYVNKAPLLAHLKNIYMKYISKGRVWCYRPWFLREEIIDIEKINSYSIDNKFFKYLPVQNIIVKWPVPLAIPNCCFKDNHKIFIFDAFVKNHVMELKDYLSQCEKLIDKEAAQNNYLKFHPGQSSEERNQIIRYFENKRLSFEILDNNIPFEYIIMTQRSLSLTGYGSSLLFLAYRYHHNVTCYDDELLVYPLYQAYKKNNGFMSFKEYIQNK